MGTLNRAVTLVALSLVWAYAVFEYGGVVGFDRKVFLFAAGLVGFVWWLVNRRRFVPVPRVVLWCACLLPAWAALQLIPLPRFVLAVISPAREELLRGLDAVGVHQWAAPLNVLPSAGMNHLLLCCCYSLVFLLVYQVSAETRDGRWFAVLPLVIVAVLESVLGIAQAIGGQTASGTYSNRDHYAGLLEMVLPFALAFPVALWRGLDTRREFPVRPAIAMCVGFAAAALILVGGLSSLSRAGFIAPLFAILVMGIVAWRGKGGRSAVAALVLAAVLAGGFLFLPSDALIARFAETGNELTAEGRVTLWKESLAVLRDFPVFGCGLGGYESAFLRHKVTVPMVSDDRVHNDYLQFLIELGVAGFVIVAVLMGGIVRHVWRAASPGAEPRVRFLAIACIGSIAAIGLHSMVDFNLYIPANAMLLAWICGVGMSMKPRDERVEVWNPGPR